MKIKKFEKYTSNDFNYDYGGHAFVLARYKKGWDKFDTRNTFKNKEFVPCMVSGYPLTSFDTRNIYIPGITYSYKIDDFEIIKKSSEDIQNIINLYNSSKKYNL
jgi:hypothetical protein